MRFDLYNFTFYSIVHSNVDFLWHRKHRWRARWPKPGHVMPWRCLHTKRRWALLTFHCLNSSVFSVNNSAHMKDQIKLWSVFRWAACRSRCSSFVLSSLAKLRSTTYCWTSRPNWSWRSLSTGDYWMEKPPPPPREFEEATLWEVVA